MHYPVRLLFQFALSLLTAGTLIGQSDVVISGVVDGPLSGGVPKAIEFYVINNVADLSIYGFGAANNGGGTDGEEFSFPAVAATAGSYIYVASESTGFTTFFGFAPDYTTSFAQINGDDAIELFLNGSVVDVFGDINTDGSNTSWDYEDGWAYRVDGSGPDGTTFVLANWSFSGKNALDGESTNAGATTPWPIGSYSTEGGEDCETDEEPPVAVCNDLTVQIGLDGTASITAEEVGAGSSDNCTLNMSIDVSSFDCDDVTTDEIIAYTSFEEPATGSIYTDTGDPSTDHDLINNTGEAPVNYTSVGGELGFSSSYVNSLDDVGLTDGDFVGVSGYTGDVGAYTEGSQGFELQDCDGTMIISLDAVDISSYSNPSVNLDLFVNSTGWETDDYIRVYIEFEDMSTLDLLNTSGSDIDNLGIEGFWQTLSASLSGHTSAILHVELLSNSSSESIYLDNVLFRDFSAPQLVTLTVSDDIPNVVTCVATIFVEDPLNVCSLTTEMIHDVQGSGTSVTRPGEATRVEGIVVGDYQGGDELSGFFIQEEDADADADPLTSEGIFVFCGSCPNQRRGRPDCRSDRCPGGIFRHEPDRCDRWR